MPKLPLPTVDQLIEYITNDDPSDETMHDVNSLWNYYDEGEALLLVNEILKLRKALEQIQQMRASDYANNAIVIALTRRRLGHA